MHAKSFQGANWIEIGGKISQENCVILEQILVKYASQETDTWHQGIEDMQKTQVNNELQAALQSTDGMTVWTRTDNDFAKLYTFCRSNKLHYRFARDTNGESVHFDGITTFRGYVDENGDATLTVDEIRKHLAEGTLVNRLREMEKLRERIPPLRIKNPIDPRTGAINVDRT